MKVGHRLADIGDFPGSALQNLAAFSISTAEEFLSHAAFEGSALMWATQLDEEEFETAIAACERVLGPELVEEIEHAAQGAPVEPEGALPPTSEDFDLYRRQQAEDAPD